MSGPGRDEFQNFRHDVSEHFKMLHECDRRIEKKIDAVMKMIDPLIGDFRHKRESKKHGWDVKLLAFGSAIGAAFSIATAAIMYLLGLPK